MKRALWLCLAASAALYSAACSGSGTTIGPPPPNNGFSNNSLAGQYAFSMSGTAANSNAGTEGPYARLGSFIADGRGGITVGVEDVNLNSIGEGSNELDITGGSYTINSDGRGTLNLIDSTGTLTFSITLTSASGGYIVDFPTDALSTASGNFVLQNTNSFNVAGINGNYAFDFTGLDGTQTAPESIVGQVSASVVGTVGQLSGFADDNDGGTINGGNAGSGAISGSYAAPSTSPADLSNFGRAQVSIGGITGVLYIVGPNQVKFMETASGGTLAGDAFAQSGIANGINGPFVYVMGGSVVSNSGLGPLVRGGKLSASSGSLSSIIVDTNNSGQQSSLPNSGTGTGTYTFDPTTGRGAMTFTLTGASLAFNYVFYMVSPTQAFLQEQTAGSSGAVVEDGSMFAQGSSTISNSSLAGNYGINWSGVASLNGGNAVDEEDAVGEATLSSAAALTGNVDLNEFATVGPVPNIGLGGSMKLSSDPTSHNTLTINLETNPVGAITAFAYVAANNNVLLMSTTSNRILAGVMTPQNP